MRILMIIGSYAPDPVGGSERQCELLAGALAARGHRVEVLTFRHTHAAPSYGKNGNIHVHRLGRLGPAAARWGRLGQALWLSLQPGAEARARAFAFWLTLPVVWLARLEFLVEMHRWGDRQPQRARAPKDPAIDLVHVHESGWLAGVGAQIARRLNKPVLCKEATTPTLDVIGYNTPWRARLDRQRRGVKTWIAQTERSARELRSELPPSAEIHLLANGVTIPQRTEDVRVADCVLFVGNFSQGARIKAFDVLFDAWALVAAKRRSATLTVVGGGDASPWMERLRQSGARDSVTFTGRLEDPSEAFRRAELFVLPSRIEGMSNALLEAQAFGLACVVSDIPGNQAIVRDDENGVLVPVGGASRLANAILELMEDENRRRRLGQASRQHAELHFGIERVVDQLTDIYDSLIRATPI